MRMDRKMFFLVMVLAVVFAIFAGCIQQPDSEETTPVIGGIETIGDLPKPTESQVVAPTGAVVSEPSIEVTPQGQGFAKITVNEGELVKLDLQASDPDGDSLSYTFSKPLDKNGEWQTKMGDAGEYPVTITASDGTLETSKNILIIVKAVNRKPTIESQQEITIVEGQKLILNLKATDPDNDVLVWKYDAPISSDGTWQTEEGDAGDYEVKATVSDGYLSDSTSFTVHVLKLNHPPVLEIEREFSVKEGDVVQLRPKVSDPDGDAVTISYSGWMNSDTYTTNYDDAGRHQVVVSATDGKMVESVVVWVTVENVNRAPVINGLIVK
jgi:hypothetical protein